MITRAPAHISQNKTYNYKKGETTPPCLTPFGIVKYLDLTLFHSVYIFPMTFDGILHLMGYEMAYSCTKNKS